MRRVSHRTRTLFAAALLAANLLTPQAFARERSDDPPRFIERVVRFLRHVIAFDQISIPPA